jgi:hypothetical protein
MLTLFSAEASRLGPAARSRGIDAQGLTAFVARCVELAERHGSKRLRALDPLRRIAANGGTIYAQSTNASECSSRLLRQL